MSRLPITDLKQLDMESLVTDWAGLENAIKAGAKHYLSARASLETAEAKKGKSAASGLLHGGQGVRRAENLQSYPTDTFNQNHMRLFALLFSVFSPTVNFFDRFQSRSSWLAMCIANEIIQGHYYKTVSIVANKTPCVDNTLTSSILNAEALALSTTDPRTLDTVSGDVTTETTYDKPKAIRNFLRTARDNMRPAERSVFDSQVALFKRQLVEKPDDTRHAARKAPEVPETSNHLS